MSDQYTPSTAEIRLAHAESVTMHKMMEPWLTAANKMFDRWLAQVEVAAEQHGRAQGWDQCRDSIITAGRDHTEYSSNALDPGLTLTAFLDYTEKALVNPYRTDQNEGDV